MRCVVVGSDGLLGRAIISCLEKKDKMTVVSVSHRDIDITNASSTLKVLKSLHPDVIINCAAYTDVDKCESEEILASQINGAGVFNLGIAAWSNKSYFLHFSTDYVFDGKWFKPYEEKDSTTPINAYGRSKLEGEKTVAYLIQEKGLRCAIIRTSWLFGHHPFKKDFIMRIVLMLRENGYVFGVFDEFGCPTYSCDLAEAVFKVIQIQPQGIYHCCNAGGFVSRFELVETVAQKIGGKVYPIMAQNAVEMFGLKAARPRFSALSCRKIKDEMNIELRHWKDAVFFRLEENIKKGI